MHILTIKSSCNNNRTTRLFWFWSRALFLFFFRSVKRPHKTNFSQIFYLFLRDATEGDIKRAYRKLALTCHPDKTGNDPASNERFKLIAEAYEILGDPDKKLSYDRAESSPRKPSSSTNNQRSGEAGASFRQEKRRSWQSGGRDDLADAEEAWEQRRASMEHARSLFEAFFSDPFLGGDPFGGDPFFSSVMGSSSNSISNRKNRQGSGVFPNRGLLGGGFGRMFEEMDQQMSALQVAGSGGNGGYSR